MRQTLSLAALALLGSRVDAFWRMQCGAPILVDRIDPIVYPGAVDGHVHNIMGGQAFGKTISTKQLRASKCTSCQVEPDKSNYWVPTLYFQFKNGTYAPVPQKDGMLVYYIPERGAQYGETVLPFPEDFGMIAGDPKLRTYDESADKKSEARMRQDAIGFTCLNYKNPETEGFAMHRKMPEMSKLATCVDGLRADINFPSCWNGKLDSDNHRDHMAYPDGLEDGKCPKTHPKRLITLKYEVSFMVSSFASQDGKFIWSTGDETGYSYHGDFYNGWDEKTLPAAMKDTTCVPKEVSITGGVIENCKTFTSNNLLQSPEKQHECKIAKTLSGVKFDAICEKVEGMMLDGSSPAPAAAKSSSKKGKGKGKKKPAAAPAAAEAAPAPAAKGAKQPQNQQPKAQKPPVHAKDVVVTITETLTATKYVPSTTTCLTVASPRVRRHFRFHRRSE
ncbi:hypothetical protein TWF696_009245 [Orbilia brochopaga]|uniref:DUF1996 domain-containing protein n=1 Tax=Orbilia brochopaga TaxID=3140254 RepID=A0AAV9UGW0_9PEZI